MRRPVLLWLSSQRAPLPACVRPGEISTSAPASAPPSNRALPDPAKHGNQGGSSLSPAHHKNKETYTENQGRNSREFQVLKLNQHLLHSCMPACIGQTHATTRHLLTAAAEHTVPPDPSKTCARSDKRKAKNPRKSTQIDSIQKPGGH